MVYEIMQVFPLKNKAMQHEIQHGYSTISTDKSRYLFLGYVSKNSDQIV